MRRSIPCEERQGACVTGASVPLAFFPAICQAILLRSDNIETGPGSVWRVQRIALVTNHRGNACEWALVRKGNDTAGWTAGNAGHPVYENARAVSIFCKRSVACLAGNSAGTRIEILDPLKAFNAIFCPGEGRAAKVIIFIPCTLHKCRQGGEQSFMLKQFIKSASYRALVDGRFL